MSTDELTGLAIFCQREKGAGDLSKSLGGRGVNAPPVGPSGIAGRRRTTDAAKLGEEGGITNER
jgi:hypothetical protein